MSAEQRVQARRRLSQERLALCAWAPPDQGAIFELSRVLSHAPAHARVGLALWLQDAASRESASPEPEMRPERFAQRRSTRVMIPHTTGDSDRVLFSVRRHEASAMNVSPVSGVQEVGGHTMPPGSGGAILVPKDEGPYEVKTHGERRARRERSTTVEDQAAAEFTGVPLPAWIMAEGNSSK